MEDLKDRIKRLRGEAKLSKSAVARECGVSHQAVMKWENGDTQNLKLSNLVSLASVFRVQLGDLLAGTTLSPLTRPPLTAREQVGPYLPAEEQEILAAFRAADATARSLLQAQARAILEAHKRKRA